MAIIQQQSAAVLWFRHKPSLSWAISTQLAPTTSLAFLPRPSKSNLTYLTAVSKRSMIRRRERRHDWNFTDAVVHCKAIGWAGTRRTPPVLPTLRSWAQQKIGGLRYVNVARVRIRHGFYGQPADELMNATSDPRILRAYTYSLQLGRPDSQWTEV